MINGIKNTIETYGLSKPNPSPFQNVTKRRVTLHPGMRLRLLTETHIGTPVWLKRLVAEDFTRTTSLRMMQLKFQKRGCPRSNNTAADR